MVKTQIKRTIKTKKMIDMKRLRNLISVSVFTFFITGLTVNAQKAEKTFSEIEKTQDEIESLYIQAYDIMEKYPEVTYNYVYEDDEVVSVNIEGIPNKSDHEKLKVFMIDINDLENDIVNLSNRVGTYYVAETEPKPKDGYEDFYDDLKSRIDYPETAKDDGLEGVVYAKFVINSDGEINQVFCSESFNEDHFLTDRLVQEAKSAVKSTSGDWVPAKIGGIPVAHWMVIPVKFDLKERSYIPHI